MCRRPPFFDPVRWRCSRSASSSVVRRSRETRCSLLFTRSDMFTAPPGFRNPSACADSDDKACAMVGTTADDAVTVRNLLRLGRGVGLAVCAVMRAPFASSLPFTQPQKLTVQSAMGSRHDPRHYCRQLASTDVWETTLMQPTG